MNKGLLSESFFIETGNIIGLLNKGMPRDVLSVEHELDMSEELNRITLSWFFKDTSTEIPAVRLEVYAPHQFFKDEGVFSGIHTLKVADPLHGLGIGKLLVKNTASLFEQWDEKHISLITMHMGAYFWQSIGFTAEPSTQDNYMPPPEADDDLWSHKDQFHALNSILNMYEDSGDITRRQYRRAIQTLDLDNPKSIWKFIDLDEQTRHGEKISQAALRNISVLLRMDLEDKDQTARLHSKTKDARVDADAVRKRLPAFIRHVAEEKRHVNINRIIDGFRL